MNKGHVTLISLIIVICLLFSIMACTTSEQSNKKGSESTSKTDGPLPNIKLQNDVVTWLFNGTEVTNDIQPAIDLFEKYYNAKVQSVAVPSIEETKAKLIAMSLAGDAPDLYKFFHQDFPEMALRGIVQPIDEYVDLSDPLWKGTIDAFDYYKYDGKRYVFITKTNPNVYVYYNKNIFDQNGIETPLDYYKKGQWDWNTLMELNKRLTQDTNKDGTINQHGVIIRNPRALICSSGTYYVKSDSDGGVLNNLRDPEIMRALDFYQEVHRISGISVLASAVDLLASGKVAMLADGFHISNNAGVIEMFKRGDLSIVPFPKDPKSNEYITHTRAGGMVLPKGSKNPQGGAALAAAMAFNDSSEEQKLIRYEAYRVMNGYTDLELQMLDEAMSKKSGLEWFGFTRFDGMRNELLRGAPLVTTIEKYYAELQQNILAGRGQ